LLTVVVGAEVEVVGAEVEVAQAREVEVGAEVAQAREVEVGAEVAQAWARVEVQERVAQRRAGPATEVVTVTAAAERLTAAAVTHLRAGTRSVQAGAPRSRHLEAITVPAMLPRISRQ